MEYTDNRGRKIVYVGNCVLNQNNRGFGAAVTSGTFADFVQILLRNEIGIEQLPCPECLAWGGIGRKSLYKWQPLAFNSVGKWWFPIIQFFAKVTTLRIHGRVSKQKASRAADWMEDHIKQGFDVVGVVIANDSPTCGVTKTMDLLDIMKQARLSGMTLDDFENPHIEKIGPFLQSVLVDGVGAFGEAIMNELRKRRMDIKVIGWDPWAEPKGEAVRIARLLDLQI